MNIRRRRLAGGSYKCADKRNRGLDGEYVVWYRGGEFRALKFQLFEEKEIRIDWVSLSVWGKKLVVTDERVFIFLCASPPAPQYPPPHYSTLLLLAQYRERESGDSLLSRDLLSCAWPGNNNNFWNQKFLSFSLSSLATQKGLQNHNTGCVIMRVRFNIFHCKWQSCHWVLYLPSPVFQTETTRPMCNRVLIYIPSLNRNIVSFSTLRVMLLSLLLLLSSQSHRLKMETRTKGMSHDEAVWVKRGQHLYFPIRLDIFTLVYL